MDPNLERKTHLLASSRYFKGLSPNAMQAVANVAALRTYPPGTIIIKSGDDADAMYAIESGTVEVYDQNRLTGTEHLLRRLGPGDCFGELSMLCGEPRTANVRAREGVTLLAIGRRELELIMNKLPAVGIAMCVSLARWLRKSQSKDTYRFVRLEDFPADKQLARSWSDRKMLRLKAVPLREDGGRVIVGMVEPTDIGAAGEVREQFPGKSVEIVAIVERELNVVAKAAARAGRG